MDRCVSCGADLGVGRYCLNCGHRIGEPAPEPPVTGGPAPAAPPARAGRSAASRRPGPSSFRVRAAAPAPVPPATPPGGKPSAEQETPSAAPEWDPGEDLLPYEEVDDLEADAPLRGNAWIAWVVGAVLLVALVLVLLEVLGTDGEDSSAATDPSSGESFVPDPDPGSTATDAPTGVGKRFEMAASATVDVPDTAPATTDLDGNLVAYVADQMRDGTTSTAWRMAGDASGQTVTITLAEPGVVQRVGLVNGYAKKVAGVNWYPNNRRILAVTWGFDDGSTVEQTFEERPGMQKIAVPRVQTQTVTIRIDSVTPPGTGNLGRDYTAISEVSIIGKRAG